jgi:predicted RecA/RadA family phage recombinase
LFGVAQAAADSGSPVVLKRRGVFELPKASGAWTQGDQLFWDASAKNFTKTAAANTPIGIAFDDAGSSDTTGQVDLSPGAGAEASVAGVAEGYKLARGVASITGSGTVVTGLATVVAIVATMQADASLSNGIEVTATIGDQAGTPAAGSVILKVWKPTAANDVTPIASAAAVSVNWVAIGT